MQDPQRPKGSAGRTAPLGLDTRQAALFNDTVPGVTTREAIELLEKFRAGRAGRDEVVRTFQAAPVADLGFAQVDTHRALRKGFPEVIFGAGKTAQQLLKIASKLLEREQRILVTRVTSEHARLLRKKIKHALFHELARCVTIERK